jgi:hypothetical protein
MPAPTLPMVRFAGLLYLVIIVFGISSEVLLRGPLVASGSADAVASAIAANPVPLRLSIAADAVMAMSDAALAVLLFLILRAYGPGLALAAMVFRLMQGAVIAAIPDVAAGDAQPSVCRPRPCPDRDARGRL